MVWGKAGSTTLSSAGDTLDVTGLTGNTFYMVLADTPNTGGTINHGFVLNNDTSSNYAYRKSENGGTDVSNGNQPQAWIFGWTNTSPVFSVAYITNLSNKEKLIISNGVAQETAGAGTAPDRNEAVNKWSNTSSVINNVDLINISGTGNFDTDSNLSALGSDMTPAAAVPATILDGLIFEETDTNKHYIYDSSTDTWTEL